MANEWYLKLIRKLIFKTRQAMYCTYNVTWGRVRAVIVDVEKQ